MTAHPGTVYLVGAGPGDPDLITVRGHALLKKADVVIHDRLIDSALLALAKPGAELIDVGKRCGDHKTRQEDINALLIRHARAGRVVVRLKGGDPFVFGRGGEELAACREARVPCVVVPGVSSAIAAPAAAGIPLTHRGLGRSVAVVTGHTETCSPLDYPTLAKIDTVVILMGRAPLADITAGLIAAGKPPDTPAACIEQATLPQQRVAVGTLGTIAALADERGLAAPMVTIIGAVAALAL